MMFRKALRYWAPLALIGVLNGIFRALVLMEFADEFLARQISSVLMITWILVYAWTVLPFVGARTFRDAVAVGGLWFLLTVTFEFSLGFVSRTDISTMLMAYDVRSGNLWGAVVLCTFLAPPFMWFEHGFNKKSFHHL
jgi:hypothetical protein